MLIAGIGRIQRQTKRRAFILHEERSDTWLRAHRVPDLWGGRWQGPDTSFIMPHRWLCRGLRTPSDRSGKLADSQ